MFAGVSRDEIFGELRARVSVSSVETFSMVQRPVLQNTVSPLDNSRWPQVV